MNKSGFLVTSTVNDVSWKTYWDGESEFEVDHPVNWKIYAEGEQVFICHESGKNEFLVDPSYYDGAKDLKLPLGPNEQRQVSLNFQRLQPIRPAFIMNLDALKAVGPSEHYFSAGIREHLISFSELHEKGLTAKVEAEEIFNISFKRIHFKVSARYPGIRFKPLGENSISLNVNEVVILPVKDVLSGCFIYGSYWWRVNQVPVPDMVNLTELDDEAEKQDLVSLQGLGKGIGVLFLMVLVLMQATHYFTLEREESKPRTVVTEVELKKPKFLEKAVEPPKVVKVEPPKIPEPKKIVKKPPPKKVEPKIAKKIEPKKVEPPKKVAVSKPVVKPNPVRLPPPIQKAAPVVVAKNILPPPPDPSVVKAKQDKASVAKSLNFLSTGPSKPIAALAVVSGAKMSQKYGAAGSGAIPASNSALSKLANQNTGDGPISTRNARNVSSTSGIQGGHGKGLNDVQGKVSIAALYGKGSGESLGEVADGGAMSVTGPGTLSDADIEKTLAKYLQKFQYCYEKALLTDPKIQGVVQIQWTINTTGTISDAQVVQSAMNNKSLHTCLTAELSKIRFPAPKGGVVTVKKPFRFESSKI